MTTKTKQERKDESWKKYWEVKDSAYKKYEEVKDSAWKKYEEVQEPALKKLQEECEKIDAEEDKPEEIIEHNGHKYKLFKETKNGN